MNVGRKRTRNAPSGSALQEARDVIRRETAGFNEGMGLRVEWDRLSETEQLKLLTLVNEAGRGRSWSWGRLDDGQRRDLEGLIEKGADARGAFKGAREFEEIQAIADQAHVAAVRRPLTRKQETSIFLELGRGIERGWLRAPDVAVLSLLMVAFSTGRPLGPRSRVEVLDGGETALIVNNQFGPFSGDLDPEYQLGPRWAQTAEHLQTNEWIAITKNGAEWWISPGRRLRAAMAGKPIRDVVAA
jgi:hypothetical protein